MKNTKINNKIVYIAIVVAAIAVTLCFGGVSTVYADAAVTGAPIYTDVLQDLRKDPNFNIADYPTIEDDSTISDPYRLDIFQVAESDRAELFLYVYHPSGNVKDYPACRISMTVNAIDVDFRIYELKLLNSSGVFGKYLVQDYKVSSSVVRTYGIPELYREWNADIDESPNDGAVTTYIACDISKRFTALTSIDGVHYTCEGMNTVVLTDIYTGIVRYNNGFTLNNSKCDSHFLAFATNVPMDKLLSARVYYEPTEVEFKSTYTFNPWHAIVNTFKPGSYDDTNVETKRTKLEPQYKLLLSIDHVSYKGKGWFAQRYEYDRIEKAEDFIAKETLSPVFAERLENMQYVLRFLETEFEGGTSTGGATGSTLTYSKSTIVENATVLELTYVIGISTYNVGVVGDMQTENPNPGNTNTNDYNFDLTDPDVFPIWARLLVVAIVVIIIIILLAIFAPQVLPVIMNGVVMVVSAPFKLMSAFVDSCKKANEARKERKEAKEAEQDRAEARKDRKERKKAREQARLECEAEKQERETDHDEKQR